jgi:hypothetical protein
VSERSEFKSIPRKLTEEPPGNLFGAPFFWLLFLGGMRQYSKDPKGAFPGKGRLKPQEEEFRKLKRENEILKEEREILKKALAIFSKRRT